MKTIEFHCRTITPLILGEAKKGEVELRPPAIKAALRFWWRSMHSHLPDIKTLKEKEAQIFGGGGENAKSSVIDFVDFSTNLRQKTIAKLPHKEGNGRAFHKAIEENIPYLLTIGLRNERIFNVDQLKSLMIISSTLGDLGNRARRSFGSWQIDSIGEDCLKINLDSLFDNVKLFSNNHILDAGTIKLKEDAIIKIKNYPFIEEICMGSNEFGDFHDFICKLMDKSSDFKKNDPQKYMRSIGDHNNRLSSPIYLSLIKHDNYVPILTKLHNPREQSGDDRFVREYINAILNLK